VSEVVWSKIVMGTCHYCGFSFMMSVKSSTTKAYKEERAIYDLRLDEHISYCRTKYQNKLKKGAI
jgi:hypothetical protein